MSSTATQRQQPKRVPTITAGRALGSKSPLVNADIQSFLSICISSWDTNYTDSERQAITKTLPLSWRRCGNEDSENLGCPLSAEFVASDEYIKRGVARFQRDIADGYYEKSWQDKAQKAMQERADGKFDDYISQSIDEMFCFDGNDAVAGEGSHTEDSDGEYGKRAKGKNKSKKAKVHRKVNKMYLELNEEDELA